MWYCIAVATFLLSFSSTCDGTGHSVISITSYRNPMNRKQNGRCCDSFCLPCEVYFKICLDSESSDNNRCNLGKHTTRVIQQREKHRFVIRTQFPFTSFGGNIFLRLSAFDEDHLEADLMQVFKKRIMFPAVKRNDPSSANSKKTLQLVGPHMTVTVEVAVKCDPHYYGNQCTTKCIPQKNDKSGHYTCDNLGEKVCNPDWYGKDCTRQCKATAGVFTCDENGNRRCVGNRQGPSCMSCFRNWFGPHCSLYCKAQDNEEQGHYKCGSDGKKVCLPWWHGSECRTHCVPHNDGDHGHYICAAQNGRKICRNGWHGENCTVYCIPQNNDASGHYTCGIHGNKVCLEGYRPPDCKDCLLGRYGANCSMTCSNSTQNGHYDCKEDGEMKCKEWWHGPDCLQYCVRHDDSVHGHYECDPRDGSKICNNGWEGTDCLSMKKK